MGFVGYDSVKPYAAELATPGRRAGVLERRATSMPEDEKDFILWKKGKLIIDCSKEEVFRELAAPLLRYVEQQGWEMEGRPLHTIELACASLEPPPRTPIWFYPAVLVGVLVALVIFFVLLVGISTLCTEFQW
jgi:hypothetical protein